jgi:hypothetical protein
VPYFEVPHSNRKITAAVWHVLGVLVLSVLPVVAALLVKGCCEVLCVGNVRAGDELANNIPHAVAGHLRPTPPVSTPAFASRNRIV